MAEVAAQNLQIQNSQRARGGPVRFVVGSCASRRGVFCWSARGAGLICAVLACAAGGCADLLDIPTNVRLVPEAAPPLEESLPPMDAPRDDAAGPLAVGGSNAEAMGVSFGSPSAPDVSRPIRRDENADAPDGGTTEGSETPSPPFDAAAPVIDAAAPAPTGCQVTESLGPNGHCFFAVGTPLPWLEARLECQARGDGWDLAVIRAPAVDDFVAALTGDEGWIGATDADDEGAWFWVNDALPFWSGSGARGSAVSSAYENWFIGDPNGGTASNCARLVRQLGADWADASCLEPHRSVCEGPAP